MILAALALSQPALPPEAAPKFREAPAFAFACRPFERAAASPTYEYRVFLPEGRLPSQIPVRVELSRMKGVSKDLASLRLDRGNLWVFRGPGASDDSPPMFKVNAVSGTPPDVFYDFQMIFTRSASVDPKGASRVSISPSEGRLRITRAGAEENFRGECTSIDTGSVQ